ncbi:MAG: ABC transporter ATP-binding protein [Rickettsiales bacterium]|jgi:lipoprotein-releasing system ATP-binding protein|nr:ABC transporter ATP-binding protein [Rickettsiales bacterium]
MEILRLENVSKSYNGNVVISDCSLSLVEKSYTALVGPSGCGKTTLLQICGLLDDASSGNIYVNGQKMNKLGDNQKTQIRKKNIGFVFQFHHLMPEFSVMENVLIATFDVKNKTNITNATNILTDLGLYNKLNSYPHQLSGGEKQRVSIARAIINSPPLIFADEPTGNLDEENSKNVFTMLLNVIKKYNSSLLMVTHNTELADHFDQIITIKNKKIEFIK